MFTIWHLHNKLGVVLVVFECESDAGGPEVSQYPQRGCMVQFVDVIRSINKNKYQIIIRGVLYPH